MSIKEQNRMGKPNIRMVPDPQCVTTLAKRGSGTNIKVKLVSHE
jgi:hypothetical protein